MIGTVASLRWVRLHNDRDITIYFSMFMVRSRCTVRYKSKTDVRGGI